jgi:hypothetical protein
MESLFIGINGMVPVKREFAMSPQGFSVKEPFFVEGSQEVAKTELATDFISMGTNREKLNK